MTDIVSVLRGFLSVPGLLVLFNRKPAPLPQLKEGEHYVLNRSQIKEFLMASKGNVALVCRGFLIILTNVMYSDFEKAVQETCALTGDRLPELLECYVKIRVKKVVPERKFALAECTHLHMLCEGKIKKEELANAVSFFERRIGGVKITVARATVDRYKVARRVSIEWHNGSFSVHLVDERKQLAEALGERCITSLEVEDERGEVARIVNRVLHEGGRAIIVDRDAIIEVTSGQMGFEPVVKVFPIPQLPSEEELLRCSRYYTIFIPRLVLISPKRIMAFIDWYRYGVKRELVTQLAVVVARYSFRMLVHRLSLPRSVTRYLPRFPPPEIDLSLLSTSGFIAAAHAFSIHFNESMRRIEDLERKRRKPVKPKQLDPLDAFLEAFFERTPRRKIENVVKPWLEVFEKVKGLAPQATLYIICYGKGGKRLPSIPALKVDKDGTISPIANRYVPVSGIVLRGGDFERLYVDANVRRLFEYQIAPREKKLSMIIEDIEDARRRVREELNVDPFSSSLEDFRNSLSRLEPRDNILLIAFKHLNSFKLRIDDGFKLRIDDETRLSNALTLITGLIKTGNAEDARRVLSSTDLLDYLRMAVKYEMKKRGYSIRKGVMFLGTPVTVKARVYEVVRGLKGRLLAMVEEFGEAARELSISSTLERVEALLRF
ncbi:MAG: hypothetical protein QXG48_00650 [Thermofilaceae archaeon]